jgi:aminodeoxyfutalosine deaminase
MFGTTIEQEYAVAARLLDLDADGVAGLARAAVSASFLPAAGQAKLLAEIDAYAAGN